MRQCDPNENLVVLTIDGNTTEHENLEAALEAAEEQISENENE